MSIEELRDNIDILAEPDPEPYYYFSNTGRRHVSEELYIAQPGEVKMVNERVVALGLLHVQAPPEEKAAFPDILGAKLGGTTAHTLPHVAVEIGLLPGAATAWLTRSSDVSRELWHGLAEKLTHEAHRFSDADR